MERPRPRPTICHADSGPACSHSKTRYNDNVTMDTATRFGIEGRARTGGVEYAHPPPYFFTFASLCAL